VVADLAFRGLEVERHNGHAAAALQASLSFAGVAGEAVEAHAQVGAKSRAPGLVLLDHLFLERAGKEFLRQVGGLIGRE
jgi:hypothetical protein